MIAETHVNFWLCPTELKMSTAGNEALSATFPLLENIWAEGWKQKTGAGWRREGYHHARLRAAG